MHMAPAVQYRTPLVSFPVRIPYPHWRSTLKRTLSLCALIMTLITAGATNLHAQNVAVDKTSLSFSAQFGGAPVSQALTVTSSNGAAINFFTFTNVTWIKVNGLSSASGNTPSTVT